jgi:hypothetical protein
VAAFNEDREPLVIDEKFNGRLRRPAKTCMGEHQRVLTRRRTMGPIAPADGWFAVYEGGERRALVCWRRDHHGYVIGMVADGDRVDPAGHAGSTLVGATTLSNSSLIAGASLEQPRGQGESRPYRNPTLGSSAQR